MIKLLLFITVLISGCALSKESDNVKDKYQKIKSHNNFSGLISSINCNYKKKSARLKYYETVISRKDRDSYRVIKENIKIFIDTEEKLFHYYISSSWGTSISVKKGRTSNYNVTSDKIVIKDFGEVAIHSNRVDLILRLKGSDSQGTLLSSRKKVTGKKNSKSRDYYNFLCN